MASMNWRRVGAEQRLRQHVDHSRAQEDLSFPVPADGPRQPSPDPIVRTAQQTAARLRDAKKADRRRAAEQAQRRAALQRRRKKLPRSDPDAALRAKAYELGMTIPQVRELLLQQQSQATRKGSGKRRREGSDTAAAPARTPASRAAGA